MDRIRVTVTREDGYWVAVADGVRGGATESRRLADLDTEVRDLLAGLLDVDEDRLDLDYDFGPALGGAAEWVESFRRDRDALSAAQHDYETAQIRATRALRDAEVSLRDAAVLLELSFQRVQQLDRVSRAS